MVDLSMFGQSGGFYRMFGDNNRGKDKSRDSEMMDGGVEEKFVQIQHLDLVLDEHPSCLPHGCALLSVGPEFDPYLKGREGSLGRLVVDGRCLQAGAHWSHGVEATTRNTGKSSPMGSCSQTTVEEFFFPSTV